MSGADLEKLRQALKILSEAEKQLRACCNNNRITWLTAALLQFSPGHQNLLNQYEQPHHHTSNLQEYSISARTSVTQSPLTLLETSDKETGDLPCIVNTYHGINANANITSNQTAKQQWLENMRIMADQSEKHRETRTMSVAKNPHTKSSGRASWRFTRKKKEYAT